MEKKTRNRLKSLKKKAIRTAAGITAAASVLAGTLFTKPEELTKSDVLMTEAAIVCVEEEKEAPAEKTRQAVTERKKEGPFARLLEKIRSAVMKLPVWARRVFVLPLCAVGWGIMDLCGVLWRAVGSPVAAFAGRWIVAAAVLFGIAAAALKILFPDVKAKELFNKPNLIALGLTCLLMALADPVCGYIWPDKRWPGPLMTAGIGACFILFIAAPVAARRLKAGRTARVA